MLEECKSVLIVSGGNPCFIARHRYGPNKTATAVAQIKQHPTFSRFKHVGLYFPGETIDHFQLAIVIYVCVQVSRSHDP